MKKRWIAVGAALGMVLLSVGLVCIAKRSGQKTVPVISIQEMMEWSGGMYNMGFSGNITSDVSQNVYVSSSQTVEEIFVQEGDMIHVGDPLVTFDMTMANMELEMKRLDKQGIELNIQKAQRELKKLQNAKPVSNSGGVVEDPGMIGDPGVVDIPGETSVAANEKIDEKTEPYMGDGSVEDPFRFLITGNGIITGSFFNRMAKEQNYFLLEVRDGDVSTGELLTIWGQRISDHTLCLEPEMEFQMELNGKIPEIDVSNVEVHTILTSETADQYYKGDGTKEHPYTFVVDKEGVVKGGFFNEMQKMKAYFRLEVWEQQEEKYVLIRAWEQNGEKLEPLGEEESFGIYLDMVPEITPTLEVTPTPEITPTLEVTPTPETTPTPEATPTPEVTPEPEITPEPEVTPDPLAASQQLQVSESEAYLPLAYVMTSVVDGLTKDEIQKQIKEKQEELKGYELDLKEVHLELKKMEKELNNQTVKSTITGVVKTVGDPDHPGASGEPFIQVVSSEGLYIQGTISELRLDELEVGTKLNGFSYDTGVSFVAEVRDISPYPIEGHQEGNASVYPFTAYIENADGLNNYSYAELTIADEKGTNHPGVVTLEKPFVRTENGQYYVMIDDGNGRLKKQVVEIAGMLYGSIYKISSGLTVEDKIAFPYGKNVVEGTKTVDGTMQDLYR